MSLLALTQIALGATQRAAAGSASVPVTMRTAEASVSLLPVSPSRPLPMQTHEPLDELLRRFYAAVSSTCATGSQWRLAEVQHLTVDVMGKCVEEHRPADAVNVYQTISSSGLLSWGTVRARRLDQLALQALHKMPHQTRSSLAVKRLLAAEGEPFANAGNREWSTAFSLRHRNGTIDDFESGGVPADFITNVPPMSAAESFRVSLHQCVQLLRAVGQLRLPLGRNYLLTETRSVLDSPLLRSQAEPEPLALISAGILYHPFTYCQPSDAWASRLAFFEQLEVLSASSVRDMSVAQREGIAVIERGVSSLRPLCQPSLRFLITVAADWDETLHRRLAESLLLPAGARNVFPQTYSERRRSQRSTRRLLSDLQAEAADVASLSKWADPCHSLFPATHLSDAGAFGYASGDDQLPLRSALRRTEHIVRRRTRRDIVVPDAAYVLHHFHQLQQLGRHREVVLTHGVFLELARLATRRNGPVRFHAGRVLRILIQHTTTEKTAEEDAATPLRKTRHATTTRRTSGAGVTVLGLQDELALLECCTARREVVGGVPSDYTDCFAEGDAVRSTRYSAVLVAQQLRQMLACHAHGSSLAQALHQQQQQQRVSHARLPAAPLIEEDDSLVTGILSANEEDQRRPQSYQTPLFKSRSRTFWTGMPVVVATTDESTRVDAFMLGLQTYPPTGAT